MSNFQALSSGVEKQSIFAFAAIRLDALAVAAGFDERERSAARLLLDETLAPWGDWRLGRAPRVNSDIGDDGFPIEFSAAIHQSHVEPRVLLEAQSLDASMNGRWAAATALNDRLQRRHAVHLQRLHLVEDLFIPTVPEARYAMWHSFCLRRVGPPTFKIYLNPQARGRPSAQELVIEALRRLGFASPTVNRWLFPGLRQELKFFSLDLDDSSHARVKVYKIHHCATADDIHAELCATRSYDRRLLVAFLRAVAGFEGPFRRRPPSTYLSFTSGRDGPAGGTIHFPIRDYVENDRVAFERIRQFLESDQRTSYENLITAFSRRPLDAGVGMHSYVSLAFDDAGPRVTIYLSPEAYEVVPSRIQTQGVRE